VHGHSALWCQLYVTPASCYSHFCTFVDFSILALIGRKRHLECKSLHVLECYLQKFYLNAVVNCVYILPQTCNYLLLHNSYATVHGVDFCFSASLMLREYVLKWVHVPAIPMCFPYEKTTALCLIHVCMWMCMYSILLFDLWDAVHSKFSQSTQM